jgi:hypothetical protein
LDAKAGDLTNLSQTALRHWLGNCYKTGMRGFLIFVVVAGLGYFFLRQKQSEALPPADKPVATQSVGAKPTPAPLTPAPRGQASEYNYMKRALDRARDVTEQSRAQTQESQKP